MSNIANIINGKKVLLIGGAGFIGHNLALELRAKGADVDVADGFRVNSLLNLSVQGNGTEDVAIYKDFLAERLELLHSSGVNFNISDATDRYEVAKILSRDYDVVYLLAAVSHASRSNTDPVGALQNGLQPFLNVISELASQPKTRLVYLSSSTVYGHFSKPSVNENDECNPYGMYAVLKHVGEKILFETGENSELNYSVVRPSALYGERCISRRVSQIFLENAFAGRPLTFKGDRDEKLDFTYIRDLIQGLVLAGFHQNAYKELFNITYGNARPVLELVDILREFFPKLRLDVQTRDQATPLRGTLQNDKARKLLGYEPAWGLEEGYKSYIHWYLQRSKTRSMVFNSIGQINE
jgi:nucleoside-diphosphate-sugar epimerase